MSLPPPPGVYVPAVIFLDDRDNLDIHAIKAHVLRLAEGGVTGILVQGSNGEAQHLSHEERKQAISITRRTLDENGFHNVLVLAGCGAQSTRESNRLCEDAKDAGAAYVLVLTPSVWPPLMTKDAILAFHRDVASHSPLPYLIYNFPTVTAGIDLDSDIILELSNHPNIVGTKLSCSNIGKLHRITSEKPSSQFATFSGAAEVLLHGLLSGSAGGIAALLNIFPKHHSRLHQLYQQGDIKQAMELQALLGQCDYAIKKIGGISGIKALIAKHWDYGGGFVRAPFLPATTQQLSGPHFEKLENLITLEKAL